MVLGGQFVSRISMNLREDKGYTYGARAAFEFRRAPGPSCCTPACSRTHRRRHPRGDRRIRALRSDRPIRAANWSSDARPHARLSAQLRDGRSVARGAAQLALYDLPDDYFSTFTPKVLALTEEDVTGAAVKHIDPARILSVVVGDREKLMAPLKTLELGDVADVSVT